MHPPETLQMCFIGRIEQNKKKNERNDQILLTVVNGELPPSGKVEMHNYAPWFINDSKWCLYGA